MVQHALNRENEKFSTEIEELHNTLITYFLMFSCCGGGCLTQTIATQGLFSNNLQMIRH